MGYEVEIVRYLGERRSNRVRILLPRGNPRLYVGVDSARTWVLEA